MRAWWARNWLLIVGALVTLSILLSIVTQIRSLVHPPRYETNVCVVLSGSTTVSKEGDCAQ